MGLQKGEWVATFRWQTRKNSHHKVVRVVSSHHFKPSHPKWSVRLCYHAGQQCQTYRRARWEMRAEVEDVPNGAYFCHEVRRTAGAPQLSNHTPLSHPETSGRLKSSSWIINTGWLFRVITGKKDTIERNIFKYQNMCPRINGRYTWERLQIYSTKT